MSSAVETRTISVGQGRDVCLEMAGDPQGNPVLVHNGTPNSRHLYGRWIADAAEKGIYLISYDRPGYGGSTADPGHTVASGAQDVRAIAAALGLDQLGIWGISGGGPYALGCAALLRPPTGYGGGCRGGGIASPPRQRGLRLLRRDG